MSDSATPQTAAHQAPPSLGSPGKNTGGGCHFLLQCVKVKTESGFPCRVQERQSMLTKYSSTQLSICVVSAISDKSFTFSGEGFLSLSQDKESLGVSPSNQQLQKLCGWLSRKMRVDSYRTRPQIWVGTRIAWGWGLGWAPLPEFLSGSPKFAALISSPGMLSGWSRQCTWRTTKLKER